MHQPVEIALCERRIAFCLDVARAWREAAISKQRRPGNNAPTEPQQAMTLNKIGAFGEAALMLYCSRFRPVKWHFEVMDDVRDKADIDDDIDAKTQTKVDHRMIVKAENRADFRYVMISGHRHPVYELYGWCYGFEAQRREHWDDPVGGRPAYWIRRDNPILRPMSALMGH